MNVKASFMQRVLYYFKIMKKHFTGNEKSKDNIKNMCMGEDDE
ncbi:hypothetical protein [Bacillus luti]